MHPFIQIGSILIPGYGVMLLIGAVCGFLMLRITSKLTEVNRSDAFYCALYAVIGCLIGSKFLYIIVEHRELFQNPLNFLSLLSGGAVFYGGLIGGALGIIRYAKKYSLSLFRLMDALCPSVALGHAFGRIGCFLAGCCYGAESDSPFAVVYPDGGIAPGGVPLLPVQLFEAAFLLLLCVLLIFLLKKTNLSGLTLGVYFAAYGIWRFFIEFFRADARGAIGVLSTSQIISLIIAPLGTAIIAYVYIRTKNTHETLKIQRED